MNSNKKPSKSFKMIAIAFVGYLMEDAWIFMVKFHGVDCYKLGDIFPEIWMVVYLCYATFNFRFGVKGCK